MESVSDSTWTVSKRVMQINAYSEIEPGLKPGDTVQVAGSTAADGVFWAGRLNQAAGAGSNFRFAGIITSMDDNVWTISGVKVTIDENTNLYGDFVIGNPVRVEGIIMEDYTWLATTTNLVTPEGYRFEFTGEVQSINPWIVSGIGFDTADWTEIDADIQVGDKVRVLGWSTPMAPGSLKSIDLLDMEHSAWFAFFCPVLSMGPWNVGGVPLIVDERTRIKGEITLGEMVKVKGWIMDDGSWLATEIKHTGLDTGQGCFWVSSFVQFVNDEEIILSDGVTLLRSDDLQVQGDLQVGSLVRYQYCVDKDGVGTVGRIIVVYQLEEVPPIVTTGKVVICHYPPGNSGNRHTLEVGQAAVSTHLAHGDTLGPCPSEKPEKKPNKKP